MRAKLIESLIHAMRQKKIDIFTASEILVNTYGGDLTRCADEILRESDIDLEPLDF